MTSSGDLVARAWDRFIVQAESDARILDDMIANLTDAPWTNHQEAALDRIVILIDMFDEPEERREA